MQAPYLGDVVLRSVQPEILHVALLRGRLLRSYASRVIRAELVRTDAARRRAGVLRGAVQSDGLEALRIVWYDGAADDEEKSFFGGRDAERGLGAN